MGKMLSALLFVFVIQISMMIALGVDAPGSSLWKIATNPTDWSGTDIYGFLVDTLAVAAVAGIVIGTLWFKSDFLVFASVAGLFLTFGTGLYHLHQQLNNIFGSAILAPGITIATLITAPLVIAYIYLILAFWRGNDY
jgi:hypothetical protein